MAALNEFIFHVIGEGISRGQHAATNTEVECCKREKYSTEIGDCILIAPSCDVLIKAPLFRLWLFKTLRVHTS